MTKNLVLGAAFGYTVDKMKPFVLSLRRYYEDTIVFVVDSITPETEQFFQDNNVHAYIPTEPMSRGYIHVLRFKYYLDYIEKNFNNIDNIFLADIRDIVFQSSPFATYPQYPIEFFAEPEIFKNCVEHNAPWYIGLYGIDKFKEVEMNYILCSGTTIGKRETMVKYIQLINEEVFRLEQNGKTNFHCDQAIHNHLVYNNFFENFRINHNGSGLVTTIHHGKVLTFNRAGQLLNNDGTPTPVVHQYDRCDSMSLAFIKNALGVGGKLGVKIAADYAVENFPDYNFQ